MGYGNEEKKLQIQRWQLETSFSDWCVCHHFGD
jgi:hypothetical protein